jgi:hypothetical protein
LLFDFCYLIFGEAWSFGDLVAEELLTEGILNVEVKP